VETDIFCDRYLKIKNSATKQYFLTKAGDYFRLTSLGGSCFLDSFRFDISIVSLHRVGCYFFLDTAFSI